MSTQEERRRRREAKANARLEQGSQDDQENKMQEQDPEARKVLRSKYRELKQSIAEDDEELGRLDSNRFHELVDKMDDLSKEVMKPREQIADAEAVANLASKLLGNVRGMIRRSGTSPSAFVTAILAKFGNRTAVDGEVVEVQWGELGLEAIGFMREAPGVCTMLGPMDIEPKVRQAQAPRAKRARPTETARAEEVRDQGEAAAKSETDANMEIMFNILRRHRPARLDALVLNRHSFSQTVENIFSLSFLVKDGRAAITYDSDGTHLVAPKNAPSVDARQSGQVSNTQFVFRYDFNCWKMMRDGLPEGDELMPNREQPQPSQPPTQPSGTPIRKNSRNRGRESSRVNGSDDHGNESGPEGDGRRQSKRARTLVDQFR